MLLIRAFSSGIKAKTDDELAGAILKDLGAHNIADDHPSMLEDLSMEEVIAADPDYIFVTTMGDEQKALDYLNGLIGENPAWSELSAVKEDRYVVLPKDLFHYKPNNRWGKAISIWGKFSIRSCSMRSKAALGLLGLGLLVIASAALGAAAGSTVIDLPAALGELLSGRAASSHARILLHVRLPRVCASLLCGSALSVSGMLIQAVLSNPLASPNVIGVNAGAGFCTFLAMALAPGAAGAAPIGAFFGALAATLLVYAVAAGAGAGKLTIILAGVAVSSIFTAGINTIKTFFPDTLYNGSTFLIGGFSGVSFSDISPAWMMILPALALAFLLARPTDVLCLGEETAHSLGLPVNATRFGLILIACVLAGAAVSFSGLVSFVGLLCPHIVRRLFGQGRHRILLPAAALLGASFVTLCDLLSRVLFAPFEIPVGILLSFLGGPFFLLLILKQRRSPRPGRREAGS